MSEIVSNRSSFSEFVILGFYYSEKQKDPLFNLFLLIYLFTVLSNTLIIILICLNSKLHKPMYFFLCNMSFVDLFFTSVTAPNMLHMQLSKDRRISFRACMTQLFLYNAFGAMEYMMLTSMAYDRFQAICNPLTYHQHMSQSVCYILAGLSWVVGFLAALPLNILMSAFHYCSSNVINHFFCDLTALLTLACDNTSALEFVMFAEGVLIALNCFTLTITSYVFIGIAIFKIASSESRFKAFSTCASHLIVVCLFYAMIALLYTNPLSSNTLNNGKVFSLLNSYIIPMLNPVIYSLRNKDVTAALKKCIH